MTFGRSGAYRLTPRRRVRTVSQAPAVAPKVTVIIPNYNYARFLPSAVGSALHQEGVDVDVIVVDDRSTDDSVSIVQSLAALDPRVHLIARSVNGGPVATFNDGLAAASGDYLVRLDADDLLTPGTLARATALAEQFPSVGIVYGRPVHFAGEVPSRHRNVAKAWIIWPGSDWLELRCRRGVNCITSPEVLMRASVVRRVGGQRNLAHTHDMEMWFRIARESDVGWVAGADQAWHREHDASLSAREVDVITDLRERASAYDLLFTGDGAGTAEDARLHELAKGALANEALVRTSQAYSAGRGGSAETAGYLDYARGLGVSLDDLPNSRALHTAERLGQKGAVLSPYLFLRAMLHRVTLEWRKIEWRQTGL